MISTVHTYTRLTALFPGYPGEPVPEGKTNQDFTEARGSEWQWHQLCRMQVCTSLQADNHACTPPLIFLQAGCPSCRPTNSAKALKAQQYNIKLLTLLASSGKRLHNGTASVCPPVCLSFRSIMATCSLLQLGRRRQISIDICRQRPSCGQRHVRCTRIKTDLIDCCCCYTCLTASFPGQPG